MKNMCRVILPRQSSRPKVGSPEHLPTGETKPGRRLNRYQIGPLFHSPRPCFIPDNKLRPCIIPLVHDLFLATNRVPVSFLDLFLATNRVPVSFLCRIAFPKNAPRGSSGASEILPTGVAKGSVSNR
jgi:hypothetical protein